jgi:hypothetical protein
METPARQTLIQALKELHSNPEDPEAVIADFEARADERDQQGAKLHAEASAFRGIAQNMRRLLGGDALDPEPLAPEPVVAAVTPTPSHQPSNGHRPEGMEAVRRIMKDGGVWSAGEILAEMQKRGWESKESKNPIRPTEAAINRLWKVKKEIERVGRGQYRYIGASIPEESTPEFALLRPGQGP